MTFKSECFEIDSKIENILEAQYYFDAFAKNIDVSFYIINQEEGQPTDFDVLEGFFKDFVNHFSAAYYAKLLAEISHKLVSKAMNLKSSEKEDKEKQRLISSLKLDYITLEWDAKSSRKEIVLRFIDIEFADRHEVISELNPNDFSPAIVFFEQI